ncbi:hypothetical protein AB6A40_005846 [Gnathostoma spinigerum]|uniref:ENTH domain-containing protein n=1 Tax=Gnathostoma spinigerum TaxID=75299 RepID=A0ABD6EIU6_9BILA
MSDLLNGLANFTKSLTDSINTYEIRKLGDKVQGLVMNYTEAETKVREATNEDPWGPTGPQMAEIARMTYQYDAFPEVMAMLWKRMFQDNREAWRRVYKSLTLLNYLLKHGAERVIPNAREHLFELRNLESYKYIERGKDQGINVRHRAKLLCELIQDDDLLREERRKIKNEGKEKYQGFSKEDLRMHGAEICSSGGGLGRFDEWKSGSSRFSSQLDDNDFDMGREINSFQFPDDDEYRNNRESPELGIREKTPEPSGDNDDEFGSFAQARNSAKVSETVNSSVIPPVIPRPQAVDVTASKPVNPVMRKPSLGLPDLLGLEESSFDKTNDQKPFHQVGIGSFDPFGIKAPREESDDFGDFASVQHSSSLASLPAVSEQIVQSQFSVFDSPVVASCVPSVPTAAAMFADFKSLPAVNSFMLEPTAGTQSAASIESNTLSSTMSFMPHKSPDNAEKQSAKSLKLNPTSRTTDGNEKSSVKIPSKWLEATEQLNIDLDHLTSKQRLAKPRISLGEMAKGSATKRSLSDNEQNTVRSRNISSGSPSAVIGLSQPNI